MTEIENCDIITWLLVTFVCGEGTPQMRKGLSFSLFNTPFGSVKIAAITKMIWEVIQT